MSPELSFGAQENRTMKSHRITIGIFATAAIILFALLVLIERSSVSNILHNVAIIAFILAAVALELLLALKIRLRRSQLATDRARPEA
jgi:hypothetical protein